LGARINRTIWRVEFANGGWLQFLGAENAHAARGFRCDGVVVDEADDVECGVYDSVVQPWFSEPWSRNIRILGGTPRRGRYGLLWRTYRRGTDGAAERLADHVSVHATAYDAPETVSPAAVARAKAETPPAVFEREWLCSFDAGEGLVFGDVFDEHYHVREPSPDVAFSEYLVGVDHGFEDPAVFLPVGVSGHGRDAALWVLDEYYESHKTLTELKAHAGKLLERYPGARWYADPSRPDTIEEYKRLGARIVKANNAIEDGVAAIADRMFRRRDREGREHARLYVSPRCHNLIRELGLYRRKRDPRNPDRVTEAIEDRNNHCFVAGTQVRTARGDVPIESVRAGDLALTRAGFRRVVVAGATRVAPVFRLTLSDGRTLEATADHRIFTIEKGWVRLDELRYGLTLLECEKTCTQTPIASSSTACRTGDTPTQSAASCVCITRHNAATDCTRRCGSAITDPYLTATTSITGTATHSTTTSATSNASRLPSTRESTCRQSDLPERVSGSRRFDRSRPSGTERQRVERGTLSTRSGCGKPVSRSLGNATSAALSSEVWVAASPIGSALTIASRHGVGAPASTTLIARAPSAALRFESIDTAQSARAHVSVLGVESLEHEELVYCLGVEEHHEFFANGVLVHNCIDALRYLTLSHFGGPSRERTDTADSDYAWG